MTTYRLGLYGFDTLVLTGAEGHGLRQAAAGPEATVRLSGPEAVLTPILVATCATGAGPCARIAPGSGFGLEGQAVELAAQLALWGNDGAAHPLSCGLLSVDGHPVGLVTTPALRAGVTYRIAGTVGAESGPAIAFDTFGPALAEEGSAPPGATVFCFTTGTEIDTPDGPRRIETLAAGDLVTTLGNGSQAVRWIGRHRVTLADMLAAPALQPVEFAAGVIGNHRPLRVSPQHRILLNDWRAQVYFGEDEVLIPARAMLNGHTIRQVLPPDGVTYVHLLLDRHEIIVSEGALSESFHPGETGLDALDADQRHELMQLFPGLDLHRRRAAYPIVTLSEARAIRVPD